MPKKRLRKESYLLTPDILAKLRERLIHLMASHIDMDLTRIEAIGIRTVFDIGMAELGGKPT